MDDIERFQNYGMTSYPPVGSEAVVIALKGSLDQRVAVAVEKKDLRPKGEQNDVIVYHAEVIKSVLPLAAKSSSQQLTLFLKRLTPSLLSPQKL